MLERPREGRTAYVPRRGHAVEICERRRLDGGDRLPPRRTAEGQRAGTVERSVLVEQEVDRPNTGGQVGLRLPGVSVPISSPTRVLRGRRGTSGQPRKWNEASAHSWSRRHGHELGSLYYSVEAN